MTNEEGWIEWNGGECPLGPDVIADIRTRMDQYPRQRAQGWHWMTWKHEPTYFHGNNSDIIAYRIVP